MRLHVPLAVTIPRVIASALYASFAPALLKLRLIVLGCYGITWHVFSWCANTCHAITWHLHAITWHQPVSLDIWCVTTWHAWHLPLLWYYLSLATCYINIWPVIITFTGILYLLSCIIYIDLYSCYTCTHVLLNSWTCPTLAILVNW